MDRNPEPERDRHHGSSVLPRRRHA
jgi:hypothetical protein